MLITIDGPSGSGKSTVARKLARTLAFLYINQGAFFRAVGVVAKERGLELSSESAMTSLAKEITFAVGVEDTESKTGLLVNGVDRSEQLLSAEAGQLASIVAVHPTLRTYLLDLQKEAIRQRADATGSGAANVGAKSGVVVEGRDAGSVGFPDAELKLYLDADPKVRAQRRHQELADMRASGATPSVDELAQEMQARDERDRKRSVAPLSIPDDAVVIDTSSKGIDEVVKHIVTLADAIRLKN